MLHHQGGPSGFLIPEQNMRKVIKCNAKRSAGHDPRLWYAIITQEGYACRADIHHPKDLETDPPIETYIGDNERDCINFLIDENWVDSHSNIEYLAADYGTDSVLQDPRNFPKIRQILDNPNGCLSVPELLAAIADECDEIGKVPFNQLGGHYVWQAMAREVGACAISIQNLEYQKHLIFRRPGDEFSDIVGIRPDNRQPKEE